VNVRTAASVIRFASSIWITLWIPRDMSPGTSEEQVTLYTDNCMGCPLFHKWKFKWKLVEVIRDFTCSLYSFVVWPITSRWHVPRKITCENQNVSHEFSLTKTPPSDMSHLKSLVKLKIFPMSFHLWKYRV